MKSTAKLRSFLLACGSLLAVTTAQAASLFWDGTDTGANANGGDGTWDTSLLNWDTAATGGTDVRWNNFAAAPDTATFGGTAGTVTLGAPIAAGSLTFSHSTGTYIIAPGTPGNVLTLSGAITTTAGGTTNITAPLFLSGNYNSTITNAGSLTLGRVIGGGSITLSPTAANLSVGSITSVGQLVNLEGNGGGEVTGVLLAGSGAVSKGGNGTWTLSNSKNLWTGTTSVSSGTLKLGAHNATGFGTNNLSMTNASGASFDLAGFNTSVGQLALGGANGGWITNSLASTTSTLTIGAGNNAANFAGRINDGAGTVALTKVGSTTSGLNGSASSTFSGGINVNGGTFTLDYTNMTTPTNMVASSNVLSLGGGTLQVTGKASVTTSQAFSGVTVNAGGGQILSTNNSATNLININLGSLTSSAAGGTLLVGTNVAAGTAGLTITTTTDKDAQGIYGGRTVFFNGTANTGYDWATTVSGGPTYTLSALASGSYTALVTGGGTDTANSSTGGITLAGDRITNSLKMTGGTLALGSNLLTITSGGILSTGTVTNNITGTAGATRLTAGAGSNYDLVYHNYSNQSPTISAVIGDNGLNAVSFTKGGPTRVDLSGANTYTGRTYVNQSVLQLQASHTTTTAGYTVAAGATLQIGAGASTQAILGSGDITLNGSTLNSQQAGFSFNNQLNINGDVIFTANSMTHTGSATLSRNGLLSVATAGTTLTLNNVGGSGGFNKTSSGNLILTGTNTYSGPTLVSGGILQIDGATTSSTQFLVTAGTLRLGASNVLASTASLTVHGVGGTTAFDLNGFNQTVGTLMLGGSGTGGAKVVIGGANSILTLTDGIVTTNLGNGGAGDIRVGTLDLNGTTQNFMLGGKGGNPYTNDLLISSVIRNGGINIIGAGSVPEAAFSGTNTYTGDTQIYNSVLQISGSGTLGSGNYAGAIIANSGTLRYNSTANQTLSGVISGTSGNLIKNGTATLTLTAANTYTGATTVNAGTLDLGGGTTTGSIASSTVLNLGGGTLSYTRTDNATQAFTTTNINAGASTVTTVAGNTITLGTLTPAVGGTVNFGTTGTITTSRANDATGILGGWATFGGNNWAVANGAGSAITGYAGPYTLTSAAGDTAGNYNAVNMSVDSSQTPDAVITPNSLRFNTAGAHTLTLTGVTNTINSGGIMVNSAVGDNASVITGGSLRAASGGTLNIIQNNNSGANSALTIGSIIVANGASGLSKTGDGTLILTATGNNYTGATVISAGTLSLTGSLTGNTAISTSGTGILNQSAAGVISGTSSLTQGSSGTSILDGTINSYSGRTIVQNGTLSFSVGNATATGNQSLGTNNAGIGATTAVELGVVGTSSGILQYTGAAGTLAKAINVLGNGTDTIQNSGSGLLTLSGAIAKNGTTLTLKGGANGITVSGVISGVNAGSDLIIDGGITTLNTVANTYNGPTFIRNGATLNANFAGSLPTGTRTALTMDGTGSPSLVLGASQSIASLTGASSSAVNLNANTLTVGVAVGSTTFAGAISGTNGLLTKDNLSTQILSGTNTYSGNTLVSAGTLQFAKQVSLYNNGVAAAWSKTNINVNGGATMAFNIGGTGEFTKANINTLLGLADTTTNGFRIGSAIGLDTTSGNFTFDSVIANPNSGANVLGLTKLGTNSLILDQVNTYTGATTVSAGTLNVTGSGTINSTSGISVAAGAKLAYNSSTALNKGVTLNGAGTSNRAILSGSGTGGINVGLTLDDLGDTLSPGNSPGIMAITTDQTWSSFSYDWELNNWTTAVAGENFDQITIAGALNLSGGVDSYMLNILSLTGANASGDVFNFAESNQSWTILTSTGLTGFAANKWQVNASGFTNSELGSFTLGQSGNNLVLSYNAIPEPSAAALLGGLGALLLLRRRR